MDNFFYKFFIYTSMTFKLLYNIALYLGMSISLYSIAKNTNIKNPWIAFIPIIQYSIIGTLCEEYVLWGFKIKNLKWIMPLIAFFQTSFFFGSSSVFLLSIAINLLTALILHKFYYMFDPSRAFIYALVSVLGRIPMVIVLFLIKDKPMIMSAGAYPYPFANKL